MIQQPHRCESFLIHKIRVLSYVAPSSLDSGRTYLSHHNNTTASDSSQLQPLPSFIPLPSLPRSFSFFLFSASLLPCDPLSTSTLSPFREVGSQLNNTKLLVSTTLCCLIGSRDIDSQQIVYADSAWSRERLPRCTCRFQMYEAQFGTISFVKTRRERKGREVTAVHDVAYVSRRIDLI